MRCEPAWPSRTGTVAAIPDHTGSVYAKKKSFMCEGPWAAIMRGSALLVALLVVGIAVVPGMVVGADNITLSGHVERVNGSPFQGVTISIRNMETDVSLAPVLTNAGGNFEVSLPAGTYEITASYEGYRATTSYSNISTSISTLSFVLYEVLERSAAG